MGSGWGRVARLEVGAVVDEVAERVGVRLGVEGLCAGGEVGAAYVRWDDGRRSVLKWRPGVELKEFEAGPLAVVEAARRAGVPAPATELAVQLDGAIAIVQELLPGAPIKALDEGLLAQALAINEQLAGLLGPGVPTLELYLRDDGPGFCLHGPLRTHGPRAARLLDWVEAVGSAYPGPLHGDDAVHVDFHPGNLLATNDRITGVIDWDGAGRGNRLLDLVTLRFGLHGQHPAPGVVERLDAVLDELPDDVLRPLWAHMSLRMTDWAIRHFEPAAVDHWLALSEYRTD